MILYHGSYKVIEKPDLSFSRPQTDFGKGFYLTPVKTQALSWSQRFLREAGTAVVSIYEFPPNPEEKPPPDVKILEFENHNQDWLNFITACRLGQPVDIDWDLVICTLKLLTVFQICTAEATDILPRNYSLK